MAGSAFDKLKWLSFLETLQQVASFVLFFDEKQLEVLPPQFGRATGHSRPTAG